MPELPEVDAMAEYLSGRISSLVIDRVEVRRGKYLPDDQPNEITGQRIHWVARQGKYLIFGLDRGLMVGHNAMSGFWDLADEPWTFDYVEGRRTATEQDVRVEMDLLQVTPSGTGPVRKLRYHDSRLFGSLKYHGVPADCHPWSVGRLDNLAKLGPDALWTPHSMIDQQWTADHLLESCRDNKREIKDILMDQREVAGIGNIYATEALWAAKMNPWTRGKDLQSNRVVHVWLAVREVMTKSIRSKIDYRGFLRCYRQKECSRCRQKIERKEIKGRTTYFCPKCQEGA